MSETTNIIGKQTGKLLTLRRMHIAVVEGPDAGAEYTFDRDVIRIGTLDDNEVCLTDDTVSRLHAEITRTPHGVLLRDLGSTNGSFVGPVRIKEVYLGQQRRFKVGLSELIFTPADEVIQIVPAKRTRFESLVGQAVSMREVFSVLEKVGPTDLTVLLTGETGTGKEVAARSLHAHSRRAGGPMVVFDCGAVPRNLVEAEIFGHERGAFTGAVAPRAGIFEQAHGGTIFLDELGELPLEVQPALLRVLEQRSVRRVGGRETRAVDVRVVAATNRDLRKEVEKGRFREDLYYRLAVVELELPPLRDRREDFPLLIEHLLTRAPFAHHVLGVTDDVMRVFEAWHWPGNVRELRNVLLRAIPFCDGERIALDALPDALRKATNVAPTVSKAPGEPSPMTDRTLHEARTELIHAFERRYLEDLLERTGGNLSKAARMAGVDRKTIARMLKRHGIR